MTRKVARPSELVSLGQQIEVQILDVNRESRLVLVSRKMVLPNPWAEFARKYPPGDFVYGTISSKSACGVLVDLGELCGSIETACLGWYRPADQVLRESNIGEQVRARVLDVDQEKEHISLGMLSSLSAERLRLWVLLRARGRDLASQPKLRATAAREYRERANTYSDKRDYDRAIRDFDEAIRFDPEYGPAYNLRGNCFYWKGDYDRAIRDYDEAIRLTPNLATQYASRGDAYQAKKEYGRAIEDYGEALRLDPEYAAAYSERAFSYLLTQDYDRAIRDYDEAVRFDSKKRIALNGRGVCRYRKADYDQAIQDFSEAIRLDPKYAMAYLNRGDSYRAKKEYDRALQDYDEAIRIDPNHSLALRARASLLAEKPRPSPQLKPQEAAVPPENAATKRLVLKPGGQQTAVRQSFSHGRTKAVVVEKVKRRALGPSPRAASSNAPAPARVSGVVLRTLSAEELRVRAAALADAKARDAEPPKGAEERELVQQRGKEFEPPAAGAPKPGRNESLT